MRIVIAGLAIALLAAGAGSASAGPGDAEGCIAISNPQAPPPVSCSYVATVPGMYANSGSWTMVIKRGCLKNGTKCKKVITIDSPTTPGGIGYGGPGVIQPGDRVTATMKTLGSTIVMGNATGT